MLTNFIQPNEKLCRISIDDTILFFRDLAQNPDKYPSLFDHEYLHFWKEMYQKYGVKTHFNIYFQTDGFNLTQMPDKWKNEWKENASWLNLSFHALQDKPDMPYKNGDAKIFASDYAKVMKEIRRFAGEEVINKTTTVHWGEATADMVKFLRQNGIEILIGYFNEYASYYFSEDQKKIINKSVVYHDPQTNMIFIECNIVVNTISPPEIVPTIVRRLAENNNNNIVEFLLHEQYFCEETEFFQTDIKQRVENALKWAAENGYKSIFWEKLLAN